MVFAYRSCGLLLLSCLVYSLNVAGPCLSKPAPHQKVQQSNTPKQKQEQEIDPRTLCIALASNSFEVGLCA